MKLTSVEITLPTSSQKCVLSFKHSTASNPYNVKEVLGLDADEIVNQRYLGFNKSQLSEVYLLKRDIIFLIELNPRFSLNETFSDLRDALYKMIWSSREGLAKVLFKNNDESVAAISGTITKFETAQFSESQGVKLTFRCAEPLLKAVNQIDVDVSHFTSLNLDITDHRSTAPHGFKFQLKMLKNSDNILLGSPGQGGVEDSLALLIAGTSIDGFQINDMIYGSSEYGNKYLYLMRGIEKIPLIDMIQFNSSWPLMRPGLNTFFLKNPDDEVKIISKWMDLTYFPTYWGV